MADEIYCAALGVVLRLHPAPLQRVPVGRDTVTGGERERTVTLEETVARHPPARRRDRRRGRSGLLDAKTKPRRSLGRLEELACQVAAIRGTRRAAAAGARRSW